MVVLVISRLTYLSNVPSIADLIVENSPLLLTFNVML
jgi:hypothetical protein